MAKQGAGGWEIVGGLIGVGLVAGLAYTLHAKMQEAIEALLAQPFEDALESLAASVPAMEDDIWQIFASELRSRAQQSSKAGRLFLFADDVRQTAPHIRRLLYLPPETLIASTFEIVEKLDASAWAVFQLTLAGFSASSDVAASVLGLASGIRRQHVALQHTCARPPEDRLPALIGHMLHADEHERGIFRSVLARQAVGPDKILLDVATLVDALLPLTRQIAHGTPDQATSAIIDTSPQLRDIGWSVLKMMLIDQAERAAPLRQIIPALDQLREAIAYADALAALPAPIARQRLIEDAAQHAEPDMPWPLIRLVWHRRAQAGGAALALSACAERLRQALPFVAQLLAAAPAEQSQRLVAAACSDDQGDIVSDILAVEARDQPSAAAQLDALRALRHTRQQIAPLLEKPAAQAGEDLRALASAADEPGWQRIEAVLRFLSGQDARAHELLRIGIQERGQAALRSQVWHALADGVITDEERAEIAALSAQLRLPPDLASRIVDEARASYAQQAAAEARIRNRIREALADDVLTDDELRDIHHMRDQLHVRPELVEQILAAARSEREAAHRAQHAALPSWIPQELSASPELVLVQRLRAALDDHMITAQEGGELEQLRQRLKISTDRAQLLLRQVHQEQQGDAAR